MMREYRRARRRRCGRDELRLKARPVEDVVAQDEAARGLGCTAYVRLTPNFEPSPRRAANAGASRGVVMMRMSRMPASISTLSG
jgi:hypothetical protein